MRTLRSSGAVPGQEQLWIVTRLGILFAVKRHVHTRSGDKHQTIVRRTAQPISDGGTDVDRQVLP
ncbi:MAG TPA: hypothetical protein VFB65_08685, partial [Pyrinomonadaceae bacterium]|nr:hypothetical protein [Pyrinomonadaceae bacterium]